MDKSSDDDSDEILQYKTRKAKFFRETSSCISCVHIHGRIWVGNVGAGLAILDGTLGNFGAVFNASSYEREGVDYEEEYASKGILYATSWDKETGNTFSDAPFASIDDIAAWIHGLNDKKVVVFPHGKRYEIGVRGYNTRHAFVSTVVSAATEIRRMEMELDKIEETTHTGSGRATKKNILVHCMAGVNRSVSCIITYLMRYHEITLKEAKELITIANGRRKSGTLKNDVFKKELQGGIAQLDPVKMRELYLEDVEKIRSAVLMRSTSRNSSKRRTENPLSRVFDIRVFDGGLKNVVELCNDRSTKEEGNIDFCVGSSIGDDEFISVEDTTKQITSARCVACGTSDISGMIRCSSCRMVFCSLECHILHAVAPKTCPWYCRH